ncbi:MAG: bifunctional adenosylcobinamide kinase/adenosylcobinamide-phosphate guanylyltransferase [Rhizobiaceae bacterium]|nr:bifunctional adenosylcobinamide kinase/adenosylcobinamide-phosphate guanylyltransferase [Rhizobiaceae bacterium]
MSENITFILGGARSGKSKFAEDLVLRSGLKPIYLATGRAFDDEMVERIESHQNRRGEEWETVEEPLALVDALSHAAIPGRIILVDCLTLWITNLMMAEANVGKEAEGLANYMKDARAPIVLVSNEVGQGVVPENKMAREFVDLSGLVHQRLASVANDVYFVTAGLPNKLK